MDTAAETGGEVDGGGGTRRLTLQENPFILTSLQGAGAAGAAVLAGAAGGV